MLTRKEKTPRLLSDERTSTETSISVLSLREVKDYLEVTHDEDDAQINAHLLTARDYLDRTSGHRIDEQTRAATFNRAARVYEIPSRPVDELTKLESLYEGEATDEGVDNVYMYGATSPEVHVKSSFAFSAPLDAVRITYTAGYSDSDDVPDGITEVLLKMVSDLYENRTSLSQEGSVPRELAMQWKDLLTPYSIIKF